MAEPSKLRQVFPKGRKPTGEKRHAASVGELGDSLKDNDPETLKFIGKHTVHDHGDREDTGAFKVATKYSLDDPKNKRLKGHGKSKEKSVYEAKEKCSICGGNHTDEKHKSDKSQGEPAYKKDKALLLGGKKIREDTLANRIAMDILEMYKEVRLDEAANLNPYAADKIGGGGMGGGARPPTSRTDIFKAFDKRTPASNQSWWGKLTGKAPTDAEKSAADASRATAKAGIQSQRDAYGRGTERSFADTHEPNPVDKGGEYKIGSGTYKSTLNPEGGKAIGKSVHKIDMGNPKFPKTVKGGVKEDVKLSKQHDTHDTDFPTGPAVGKAAEGETQGHHKPDGPTSNKSKKLVKTDTKKPATFKEGLQLEPGLNQVDEDKVEKTMHEFKHGTLHSGSKKGPKVTDRKQAIAIALNQKRKANEEVVESKVGLALNFRSKTAEGRPSKTKQSGDVSNLSAGDLRQTHIQKKSEKPRLTAKGPFINSSGWAEDVNAVEPLLGEGGDKKKKKQVREGGAPADTPIRYTNSKSDTSFALEAGKKK